MHKLTARIAGELEGLRSGALLEGLEGVKGRVLRGQRNQPQAFRVERKNIPARARVQAGGLGSRPGTLTHPIPPRPAPSVIPWQPIGAD